MQIFISWSGKRSKAVAEALRDWLRIVIQASRPWMSSSNIQKGERWSDKVAAVLKEAKIGIICLTPENMREPWILFEAGALSKTMESTYVCPYLFEIDPNELDGPLGQFQATMADRDDTFKLLQTINSVLGESALGERDLVEIFDTLWPALERKLKEVPPPEVETAPPAQNKELLQRAIEMLQQASRG